MSADLHQLLRSLRVWDPEVTSLPGFDPEAAPGDPVALFVEWFAAAVAAGQPEPHTMALATADAEGRPDVRTVMLHGADADGWAFATHAGSRKGHQLAVRPYAALHFYWPVLGRQVRVRGPVEPAPGEQARADLRARSTGALAAALTGGRANRWSRWRSCGRRPRRPGSGPAVSRTRRRRRGRCTGCVRRRPSSSRGDAARRHVRLTYRRDGDGGWTKGLLWP
ncbi:pyridoxal 5'-phosphate synthase [Streptomyces thermocoprophilus]